MQYNVSDLRAAYDQYGLSDADQLVVGGMDDDVMKIGTDGQLVPVECANAACPASAKPGGRKNTQVRTSLKPLRESGGALIIPSKSIL